MKPTKAAARFVLCVRNDGSEDLEPRKIYQTVPDPGAAREGYVRVIDESGEDYLYPTAYFVRVSLPAAVARNLGGASEGHGRASLQPTGGERRRPRRMRLRPARG
jgi:hypothetical protein